MKKKKYYGAIGDKVEYKGELFTIADNRGYYNLWGGSTGTKQKKVSPYDKALKKPKWLK